MVLGSGFVYGQENLIQFSAMIKTNESDFLSKRETFTERVLCERAGEEEPKREPGRVEETLTNHMAIL